MTPVKARPILSATQKVVDVLLSPVPKKLIVVHHDAGFFSNFNKVMNHLVCSLNCYGVLSIEVDWNMKKRSKYNNFFYGTHKDGNIWEHFFEQPLFTSRLVILHKRTTIYRDLSITGNNAYDLYKSGDRWRQQYHSTFKKYIQIKPHILQDVERTYAQYLAGKYCIGVHIRNNAIKGEQPDGQMPPLEHYMAEIRRIIFSKKEEVKIFLATDIEEYVNRFKSVFGDKIVTQKDVTRLQFPTDTEEEIIYLYNPNLKRGEDVLKDCLLLSKCDVLVHRVSNIATAVGYINPSIPMIYCQ
jgi:hypothetical protein